MTGRAWRRAVSRAAGVEGGGGFGAGGFGALSDSDTSACSTAPCTEATESPDNSAQASSAIIVADAIAEINRSRGEAYISPISGRTPHDQGAAGSWTCCRSVLRQQERRRERTAPARSHRDFRVAGDLPFTAFATQLRHRLVREAEAVEAPGA